VRGRRHTSSYFSYSPDDGFSFKFKVIVEESELNWVWGIGLIDYDEKRTWLHYPGTGAGGETEDQTQTNEK
jgi:hypothetical protein